MEHRLIDFVQIGLNTNLYFVVYQLTALAHPLNRNSQLSPYPIATLARAFTFSTGIGVCLGLGLAWTQAHAWLQQMQEGLGFFCRALPPHTLFHAPQSTLPLTPSPKLELLWEMGAR